MIDVMDNLLEKLDALGKSGDAHGSSNRVVAKWAELASAEIMALRRELNYAAGRISYLEDMLVENGVLPEFRP